MDVLPAGFLGRHQGGDSSYVDQRAGTVKDKPTRYRGGVVGDLILPRFGGQLDYAASAATWAFNSNSIGLM